MTVGQGFAVVAGQAARSTLATDVGVSEAMGNDTLCQRAGTHLVATCRTRPLNWSGPRATLACEHRRARGRAWVGLL